MQPVVLVFLCLNAIVFIMWSVLGESPLMIDHFLISWDGLVAGRVWTLLTSEFSHLLFLHFFLNMYVLASFGPIVERTIGSGRFLAFYLIAAVLSSLSHAGVSAFVLGKPQLPALGASGAISGVIMLFALLYPRARIFLFGIVPMPAIFGAVLFVGIDAAGLVAQTEGGGLPIGHGAHLGGAATGLLYYLFVIRHLRLSQFDRLDFADAVDWRRLIRPHIRIDPDKP